MTSNPDCIFCKIVAGEVLCFKIHEDAATLASSTRSTRDMRW